MNFSKKDYKKALSYWASCQFPLWKELEESKKEIKRLQRLLKETK